MDVPAEGCETMDCKQAKERCTACGATETPCDKPDCILAHEAQTVTCAVCDQEVAPGTTCDRIDCPRIAAEQIKKASLDTPFKLGL